MVNKDQSKESLRNIEALLNGIHVHGGNTKITKDLELSRKSHDVAGKVSMGGAKSRHFLFAPNEARSSGQ